MKDSRPGGPESVLPIVLAFAAIYLVWGSTYLAIRWAIETIPPFLMASVRFVIAGCILLVWQGARGVPLPTRRQWRAASIAGALLLVGGNGAVVVAEQWVPSGLTALFVASVPLWMVLIDALFGSRGIPSARSWVGLVVGFGGVVLLVGSPGAGAGGAEELFGALLVLAGSISWASGSIYTRHARDLPPPMTWIGSQMLIGGALFSVLAFLAGDFGSVSAPSGRSLAALAYLVLFGALIGYGAYVWLLRVVEPARVATYAYVNPVIALLLGWALAGEPLGYRSLAAAAIILVAVAMITTDAPRRTAGRAVSGETSGGGDS